MEATELSLLRLYIADPAGHDELFTDSKLEALWSAAGEDVNGAAAEAWRIKAASVADWYDVMIDGAQLNRDQVWRHCIAMATYFTGQGGGSLVNVKMDSEFEMDSATSEFD